MLEVAKGKPKVGSNKRLAKGKSSKRIAEISKRLAKSIKLAKG